MPLAYLGLAGVTLGYLTAKEINKAKWMVFAVIALVIWFKLRW
ncbi:MULTISPECIES: hypothetical protein [Vibrio]|jgi:hypothetical protein|uniref:Membrane transporter protein n=1 Tax=Vibrio chaetopteri TaxID=3016528 RepID=A0AAU8BIL1_9VIBR